MSGNYRNSGSSSSGRSGGSDRGNGNRGGTGRPPQGRPSQGRPSQGHSSQGRPRDDREPKVRDPLIDEGITGRELDKSVVAQLRGLPDAAVESISKHLVMSGMYLDEDPAKALEHALAARRRAARLACVREATGLAAYRAGDFAMAATELRAFKRMTGDVEYVHLIADCERGLGNPDKALETIADLDPNSVSVDTRIELLVVAAGARMDLGQQEAALLTLKIPQLGVKVNRPWVARLRYAYADLLEQCGDAKEAEYWFAQAVVADEDGITDADDRLAMLQGTYFVDFEDDEGEEA